MKHYWVWMEEGSKQDGMPAMGKLGFLLLINMPDSAGTQCVAGQYVCACGVPELQDVLIWISTYHVHACLLPASGGRRYMQLLARRATSRPPRHRRKLQRDIAQRVLECGYEFNRKAWKVSAMRSEVGVTVPSVAIKAV